jgi:hypothetical protein
MMRGADETSGSLFSYVDLEERIPARHPLRKIRQVVNGALSSLDAGFAAVYTDAVVYGLALALGRLEII